MWSTRKELETALAQAGLEEWSSRLAVAARHAIILEPGPLEEGADAPIGASRLGGMPDLPADVPWPWRPALSGRTVFADHAERTWPLTFVAQIDFAEIHSAGGLEGFPSSGRLLFFCDPILEPWGWSSDDKSCASVMFFTDETDRLARRRFPAELSNPAAGVARPEKFLHGPRDVIFRPRRMTPRLWLLPPPRGSVDLATLDGLPAPPGWTGVYPKGWDDKTYAAYDQFWTDLKAVLGNAFGEDHQVGGTAFPETGPVEADCVKYGDDDYANDPPEEEKAFRERREKDGAPVDWPDYEEWSQTHRAFLERERASYFARAGNWQLVLQLACDGEIGPWGVEGHAYLCIRKTDLAECRFDRCWAMWQCS